MPNPGSPQSMQQAQQNTPPMPKGTMIGMLLSLVIMLVVYSFYEPVGKALNVVFQVIAFGGNYPVLTLVICGLIMITISTIIRSYMTDFVTQTRNQRIQTEFNKELRQARLENNLFKLKKLQEEQPKMTAKTMEASTKQMRTMPITMLVVIPVYAWVRFFIYNTLDPNFLVMLPWNDMTVNLQTATVWIMPLWIVIYTLISLPVGQLENRVVRYFLLKKRLKELDGIS